MRKVVRHLVDEIRRSRTINLGATEVLGAEFRQFVGTHSAQNRWILRCVGARLLAAEATGDGDNIRQLHRPLDHAVAGEDLLEQGGPGAGQSDDENRRRGGMAAGSRLGKPFLAEQRLVFSEVTGMLVGVPANGLAPRRVPLRVAVERLVVLSTVFQSFSQRERQVITIVDRLRPLVDCLAHCRDLGIVKLEGFEIGQAPVRFAKTGRKLHRALIRSDGIRLAAERLERVPHAHAGARLGRIALENPLVDSDCGLCLAYARQNRGLEQPMRGPVRLCRDCLVDFSERLAVTEGLEQQMGVVIARQVKVRRQFKTAGQ